MKGDNNYKNVPTFIIEMFRMAFFNEPDCIFKQFDFVIFYYLNFILRNLPPPPHTHESLPGSTT